MAESADSAGDGEKSEATPASSHSNLPMVVAPKLGAAEDEMAEEAPSEAAAAPAAKENSSRFLVLAASVAFAAAFGSFVGSFSGAGLSRIIYPSAPGTEKVSATEQAMKAEIADLSTLKASLETAIRNTNSEVAKITDRLDKHASAAPETTGSIAASPPLPPPQAAMPLPPVIEGWIVQDVENGRALVASRYGGVFDVGAGSVLPGIGRVDAVKRQDGQWIVITARGTITSGR
jgi:hypothetical protein